MAGSGAAILLIIGVASAAVVLIGIIVEGIDEFMRGN